jgi:Ser/Thr protein kinase RdoA (MazF antagonist)
VPPPIAELISLVEEVRRHRRQGSATLDNALPRLELRPLAGGRNNLVFAWNGPDGEICLKLYRTDKRDRAACEYQALTHVAACGITAAPKPLWHDPDPELPAVAMTMVAGQPVSDLAEPATALRAAITVIGQLREIPLGPFVDMPRVDSATHYMERIIEVWPAQLEDCNREPLTVDMWSLLGAWEQRGDAAVLAEPAPRVFSRGDSNLLNWLWDEPNIHLVDWEFVGYSDTAYDAAELVEHLSAHAIDDEWWISLLPDLGIVDDATRHRFRAARRTVALRWLSVLWKQRNQRVDEFEFQFKRVRELMNSDFL